MREKKFNFEPLRTERVQKTETPVLSITAKGVVIIGRRTLEKLRVEAPYFIKLYEDSSKRALAFKFVETKNPLDSSIRFVSAKKGGSTTFSISSYLKRLSNTNMPLKKLKIHEYKDTDSYIQQGKLYYVRIPHRDEPLDDENE